MNNKDNNFRAMTSQMFYPNYARMGQSFNPSQNMIPKMDFTTPQLVHNNMRDKLDSVSVVEHHLHVDSRDRNTRRNPNPLNLLVQLNPSVSETGLIINKNFKNVKYVRINNLIIPTYINFTKTDVTEAMINLWSTDDDANDLKLEATDGTEITPAIFDTIAGSANDSERLAYLNDNIITSDLISHIQTELADDLLAVQNGDKAIGDVYYKGIQYETLMARTEISRVYSPTHDYDYYLEICDSCHITKIVKN